MHMCDVNSVDIPACVDVYVCISGGMCGHVTCWCFVYVHMWESVCLWPYDDMYEYAYMWAVCMYRPMACIYACGVCICGVSSCSMAYGMNAHMI